MIKYIFIIFFIFISVKAIAFQSISNGFDYTLQAPPKTSDMKSLYPYLYTLYTQWMTGQVTKTSPNGNIDSAYGSIAIYYDGTNYWLMVETTSPSGNSWVGTKLGVIS